MATTPSTQPDINTDTTTDSSPAAQQRTTSAPTPVEAQARAQKLTQAFGEIVALLSRSPVYRHMSLADLEWLVLPPLLTNQVTTVRGKLKDQQGLTIPLGLALWAHVSEEVDKKLEAQQKAKVPFRLAPQDWKSGDIPWLLTVVAPKEAGLALIKKLEDSVFKDTTLKRFSSAMLEEVNGSQSGKRAPLDQSNATSGVTLP